MMTKEAKLTTNFKKMIKAVQESQSLNKTQKQYLTDMLLDQLQIELQCVEILNG